MSLQPELELKEISALKQKLLQIDVSLADILNSPASHFKFPELLSTINTTTAHFQSIIQDLPKYQQQLLFPHVVPLNDPEFFPRVMLRTKLQPDIYEPNDSEEQLEEKLNDLHDLVSSFAESLDELKEDLVEQNTKSELKQPTIGPEKYLTFMSCGHDSM